MGKLWITRENPHVDRVAVPWLVSTYIDTEAVIGFAPEQEVLDDADAISFDAPGATYTHADGKCTFEVVLDAFRDKIDSPATVKGLDLLAKIVHVADVGHDDLDPVTDAWAIAAGNALSAVADAFVNMGEALDWTDLDLVEAQYGVYDDLLVACAARS